MPPPFMVYVVLCKMHQDGMAKKLCNYSFFIKNRQSCLQIKVILYCMTLPGPYTSKIPNIKTIQFTIYKEKISRIFERPGSDKENGIVMAHG